MHCRVPPAWYSLLKSYLVADQTDLLRATGICAFEPTPTT